MRGGAWTWGISIDCYLVFLTQSCQQLLKPIALSFELCH